MFLNHSVGHDKTVASFKKVKFIWLIYKPIRVNGSGNLFQQSNGEGQETWSFLVCQLKFDSIQSLQASYSLELPDVLLTKRHFQRRFVFQILSQ